MLPFKPPDRPTCSTCLPLPATSEAYLGVKVVDRFGDNLSGRHFAIWGLAFKPNTDDMREAPSRVLIHELISPGATVAVYDPLASKDARHVLEADMGDIPDGYQRIRFCDNSKNALQDADALIIITEWKTFRSPDFQQIKALLKNPVIFDGRNLFKPWAMAHAGIEYHGIGRSSTNES
ncbi:hypothetical protein D3871_04910 [Noviherbaspirillum saxi]|uniref:UDP-glucose 6-dehydrogenase n=1 Tax=Noviherbaspirillum saxi TaxID=2320863 RepID=A0A3A3FUR6_9BURK|nr:hypothetical protein D3871_04910 [Noviherbaspirillum saxi]